MKIVRILLAIEGQNVVGTTGGMDIANGEGKAMDAKDVSDNVLCYCKNVVSEDLAKRKKELDKKIEENTK